MIYRTGRKEVGPDAACPFGTPRHLLPGPAPVPGPVARVPLRPAGAQVSRPPEQRGRAPRRDRGPVRSRSPLLALADRNLDLRRGRPADQSAGPGADRGLRPAAGKPGPAPRPERPVARRGLARRAQGRRGGGHHHGSAASPGDRRHRGADRTEPGPVRSPLRRGTGGRRAGADHGALPRGRARRASRPLRGQGRLVHRGAHRRRRRGHARPDVGHDRPAEGDHALPPGHPGHRGHLLALPHQALPGRRVHRHAAARLHLRARRPAAVPVARGRLDAVPRAGHAG